MTTATVTPAATIATIEENAPMELPALFIERMTRLLGDEAPAFFAGYNTPLRRGLRVNTLFCQPDKLTALFTHPLSHRLPAETK